MKLRGRRLQALPFTFFLPLSRLAHRRLLPFLTLLCIAFAVTLAGALEISSRSFELMTEKSTRALAGDSQLLVAAGGAGVPESLLEPLRALDSVAVAEPMVDELFIVLEDDKQTETIHVLGLDLLAEVALRDYGLEANGVTVTDPLRLIVDESSVILTRKLATRLGVAEGDVIPVQWSGGLSTLTVRGLISRGTLADAFGGQIAVADVYNLQALQQSVRGDRPPTFDRIDISLVEGADLATAKAEVEQLAADRASVRESRSPEAANQLMAPLRTGMTLLLVLGVLTSSILAYGAFSILVDYELPEIALMTAVGFDPRAALRVTVVESVLMGVVAVGLGLLLAPLLSEAVVGLLSGLSQHLRGVEVVRAASSWQTVAVCVSVGLGIGLLGGLEPALRAARRHPLDVLRPSFKPGTRRRRVLAALVVFAVLVICSWVAPLLIDFSPAVAVGLRASLGIAAVAVFAGALLDPVLAASRGLLERIVPRVGRLLGTALLARPYNSALCAAAVASLVGAFSTAVVALDTVTLSIEEGARSRYQHGGLHIAAAPPISVDRPPLPRRTVQELREMPGVRDVAEYRFSTAFFGGKEVDILAFDVGTLAKYDGLELFTPDANQIHDALMAGQLVISERVTREFGIEPGDEIEVTTPSGPRTFKVGAMWDVADAAAGTLLLDINYYEPHWGGEAMFVGLWAEDSEGAIGLIRERTGQWGPLFVQRGFELTNPLREQLGRDTTYLYLLMTAWGAIGAIAVVTLLSGAVTERLDELALMSAVGGAPENLIWLVVCDGVLLTALATFAGVGLSPFLAVGVLEAFGGGLGRMELHFRFVLAAGVSAAMILSAALLSAVPAMRAGRVQPSILFGR